MPVDRYAPAPTVLAADAPHRVASRLPEFRDAAFDEKFDDTTLFYDSFFDATGRCVLALGPPHLNLSASFQGSSFVAQPTGDRVTPRIRQMDRHAQTRFSVPAGTDRIVVDGPLGRLEIAPRPPSLATFAGKRVLMTLSKDNELRWIQDWIRYNRDNHGANAVLVYDNASTKYGSAELASAISELGGIEAACVVDWPFKYGPQGIDELRCWDSDFCQRGVLEHARWYFLQRARSVLNGDVDELVTGGGGRSIFEAAERSLTGLKRYYGVWVYGVEGAPETPPAPEHSYAPFLYYLNPDRGGEVWHRRGLVNSKWVIAPSRCPAQFQWVTHDIIGARGVYGRLSQTNAFIYRHYREISNSWFYDRSNRVPYQDGLFIRDKLMTDAFARVDWKR